MRNQRYSIHCSSRRAALSLLLNIELAMSGYWNRSWWSKGWDSNAQEGGGRTWEVSVAEGSATSDGFRPTNWDKRSVKHHWTDSEGNVHSWESGSSSAQQPEPRFIPMCQDSEPSGSKRGLDDMLPGDEGADSNIMIADASEPSAKRPKIEVTDYTAEGVDKSGNSVGDDIKWVKQEDPMLLGPPVSQALWLVAEKHFSYQTGSYQTWFRPATQLSDIIEAQFQGDVGHQAVTLSHTRSDGTVVEHMYEHDLRGEEWVQNRIMRTDEQARSVKWSKKIIRVIIG